MDGDPETDEADDDETAETDPEKAPPGSADIRAHAAPTASQCAVHVLVGKRRRDERGPDGHCGMLEQVPPCVIRPRLHVCGGGVVAHTTKAVLQCAAGACASGGVLGLGAPCQAPAEEADSR